MGCATMVNKNQILIGSGCLFLCIVYFMTPTPKDERKSGEQKMPLMLQTYAKEILLTNPSKRNPTKFTKYKDFWGSSVQVIFDGTHLTLTSAGSDKLFCTSDDYVYEEKY
jgi:hypothetical protein